jgi:hypothetical protein
LDLRREAYIKDAVSLGFLVVFGVCRCSLKVLEILDLES